MRCTSHQHDTIERIPLSVQYFWRFFIGKVFREMQEIARAI